MEFVDGDHRVCFIYEGFVLPVTLVSLFFNFHYYRSHQQKKAGVVITPTFDFKYLLRTDKRLLFSPVPFLHTLLHTFFSRLHPFIHLTFILFEKFFNFSFLHFFQTIGFPPMVFDFS